MLLEENYLLANRYTIRKKLGAGGMAIVYQANDNKLNRFVTVKVLREEFIDDSDFVKRFHDEAQHAASLSHPNIVNVYDVGNDGDIHYIVMEYIEGITLKEMIKEVGPFDSRLVTKISLEIASAIAYAHKNKLVHRDIKPQNILVKSDCTIKVTDFGIARAASSSTISMATNAIGSVHYFSPEQAKGSYVNEKSDVYSLGIVMYEMLSGVLPFEGENSVEIALKHINEEIGDVLTKNPAADRSLCQIIRKATKKSPRERYENASALLEDLLKVQEHKALSMEDDENYHTISLSKEELREIKNKQKPSHYEEEYSKKEEWKVVLLAVCSALFIVIFISFFGGKYLKNRFSLFHVPNFVSLSWEEAQAKAKENQLQLRKKEIFSEEMAEGMIVSQNVKEGTSVKKNSVIDVEISKGRNLFIVPNCVLKEKKDAIQLLVSMDFQYVLEMEYNEDVTKDIVISQFPEAGKEVSPNTSIHLYVSLGKENKRIQIRDYTNMKESDAIKLLEQEGFVVGKTKYQESTSFDKGVVMGQIGTAGEYVEQGHIIYLIVSTGLKDQASTSEQVSQTKKLLLNVNNWPEGAEEVRLDVISVTADDFGEKIYSKTVKKSALPFYIDVSGKGKTKFLISANDVLQYQEEFDFE